MKSAVLALLALLLTMPCVAQEKTEQPAPVLTLSVKRFEEGELKFGEIAATAFTLKNESKKAVLVFRICPVTNQGEETICLFGSAYGNVVWLEDKKMFEYNDMVQSATQLPFHSGLLLPKEEVSVVCSYRPVSRTEEFSVEYCQAEVDYDKTVAGLKPFDVYLPAAEEGDPFKTFYKPFTHSAWEELGGSSSETDEPGPGVPVRAVLVRDLKAEPTAMRVSISTGIAETPFPAETAREAAAKLTNLAPEKFRLAYCSTFSQYFVFEENGTWILKDAAQTEKGKLLPVFPPSAIREIDGGG
ncbi:MAG: hypothetical protein RDV41_12960, partial [Planctomycetota bacterium]|nr:hypothetical protein [Planctomycetota bacterium]